MHRAKGGQFRTGGWQVARNIQHCAQRKVPIRNDIQHPDGLRLIAAGYLT